MPSGGPLGVQDTVDNILENGPVNTNLFTKENIAMFYGFLFFWLFVDNIFEKPSWVSATKEPQVLAQNSIDVTIQDLEDPEEDDLEEDLYVNIAEDVD
jgi:hypothetical protein